MWEDPGYRFWSNIHYLINADKDGMGYWTRSNAEVCLLATKGHPKRIDSSVHQVIISHIEEHSKKPAEIRDRIVKLVVDVPRVELFARQKTPGWETCGNEVENDLELAA